MTKKEASDSIAAIINREGIITDPSDAMIGTLLGLKADSSSVDIKDVEDILLSLEDSVAQGKAINKANRLWRDVQVAEVRMEFLDGMGNIPESTKKAKKMSRKNLRNTIWLSWSGVWRNKLQHVLTSSDNKLVDGLLEKLSFFEESRAYDKGRKESMEKFNNEVVKRLGMTARQVLKQFQSDATTEVDIGTFTLSDGVTRKNITMTKSELRQRHMELMNEDLRELAMDPETEGYTPAIIEAIANEMSNTFDTTVISVQQDFYNEYYERINKAYRRIYGVNLPQVENYIPISREGMDVEVDEFLKSIQYRGSVAPGSLKSREGSKKFRLQRRADISTLVSHVMEMEYFMAYSEKVSLINDVFGGDGNTVMNRIKDEHGSVAASTIQRDIEYFGKKGAQVASTGEKLIVQLSRNFGFAQLGAKPQIGLKQLASFSAFAQDVSPAKFVENLATLPANYKAAVKLMQKADFFTNRGMNLDIDLNDLQNDMVSGKWLNFMGRNPNFTRVMMLPIRYGDKAAIFVGGYAHVKSLMDSGMSEEQALAQFSRLANRTQQSADIDQVTELQRGNGFVRIMTQFMSSANAITRAEIEAFGEWKKGRISNSEMAKRFVIYHLMVPNFIMLAANGFSVDGEDQLKASLLGSFTGMLMIGDAIEILATSVMGDNPFELSTRHPLQFLAALSDLASTLADEDFDYEYVEDQMKVLDSLLELVSGITGVPARTLFNEMKGAGMLFDKDTAAEGGRLALGYSPYIIEKIKE